MVLLGLATVVEFRNARWLRWGRDDWFRQHDLGFCCVGEPRIPNLSPSLSEVTSKIGYICFHRRSSAKWWQRDQDYERCDYSYTSQKLSEWLPEIQELDGVAEKIFILANNHWRGQSVSPIRQLRVMLD